MPSSHALHLLRHAKSSWDDPSLHDRARPLAPRGESAVAALRAHLAESGFGVELVLCSPAERTRQTWAGIRDGVAGRPDVRFVEEIYEADADTLLALLRTIGRGAGGRKGGPRSVLLVGHNPAVADLAAALVVDPESKTARRLQEKYPTGALASFVVGDWSDVGYGRAELSSYVRPRDLPPA